MKPINITLIILFICTAFIVKAQNKEIFKAAGKDYNTGNYTSAIEKYTKILASGEHSAALYYNLANAHYKLNHIALSIYYYEKALQLAPNDTDIKNNLAFAENMRVDAIEVLPETGFTGLFKSTIGSLSIYQWAVSSIIFMLLFIIGYLCYYFSVNSNKKRLFFIFGMVALVICMCSFMFAYILNNQKQSNVMAVIFAEKVAVKSEPNNRSDEIFILHEGTKVQIEATVDSWKKVKLSDGKIGWAPVDALKEL